MEFGGFGMTSRIIERGFPMVFNVVFALVLGLIVMTIVRGLAEWNRNNHSPRLTVYARVVTKRQDVSHHHEAVGGDITGAHGYHTSSSTAYYATFEVDSGDRMELRVSGKDYGQLAEGDGGHLTFQGTRFLDFTRE